MSVALPAGCPTSSRYQPPSHPVKTFRSVSGAAARVLYGNRSSQARLSLEFALANEGAAEWMVAYEAARGTFEPVTIPPEVWDGAAAIKDTVPSHITWFFSAEPTVERLLAGRTRVSVELIGDLEA